MKPNVRWVPGFENRLACSDQGVLARKKKSADGKFKRVNTRYFDLDGRRFCAPYLVALTWLDGKGTSVRMKDGNVLNWHPENLVWADKSKKARDEDAVTRKTRKLFASRGEYLQIAGLPRYWVRSDGTLWRMSGQGELAHIKGVAKGTNRHVRVTLSIPGEGNQYRTKQRSVSLKELVGDLWKAPRPSAEHRIKLLDGRPWNTHPSNMEWYMPSSPRPIGIQFKSTSGLPLDPQHDRRHKEALEASWAYLTSAGGKHLRGVPALWALPTGQIIWLDSQTGERTVLRPTSAGKVFARSYQIHALNFMADAFATTPHAPHLKEHRTMTQKAEPIDGNRYNTKPQNLRWSAGHDRTYTLYSFSDPTE